MRRVSNSMLGVTLLEIMLVLAVAAMIIVMSVRYYQSASASQQANQVLQQIQAITSSADSLSQGTGKYSAVNSSSIGALLSNVGGLHTPWGGSITINGGSTSYSVSISSVPPAVCGLIWGRLQDPTKHYSTEGTCQSTAGTLSYTYMANPPTT